jgi:ribosomal protein L40E
MAEVEPEPEPMVAEVEPEPEPMVAEVEPERELQLDPVVAAEALPWIGPEAWVEPATESWTEPAAATELPAEPIAEVPPEPAIPPLRVVAWETDSAFDVGEQATAIDAITADDGRQGEVEPEPEPMVAEVEPEAEPEPMVAEVEPEPEPMVAEVAPEPEPMVAEVEPEPEPMVAEVEPVHPAADAPTPGPRVAPISETILHFPARPEEPAAPVDQPAVAAEVDSPELAARRAQLDLLGLGDPGEGAVTPEPPAVLPYRSRGATPSRAELAMRAGGSGFWEASAREVAGAAAQIGVQNCGECGLSLSATARFCRRCGTRQARSA